MLYFSSEFFKGPSILLSSTNGPGLTALMMNNCNDKLCDHNIGFYNLTIFLI